MPKILIKRIFVTTLMLIVILPFGVFSQRKTSTTTRNSHNQQAIQQFLNKADTALVRNDTTALNNIYADDYTFVSASGAVTTKAQRIASLNSGELKYEFVSSEKPDIRLFGNTAVATALVFVKAQYKEQNISDQYLVTTVLARINGRWQIVEQQNRITEGNFTFSPPVADYHAHIRSLVAGQTEFEPLPFVELPEDLARVLSDYTRTLEAKDPAAMAELYTEDGLILVNSSNPHWIRGRLALQILYAGAGGGFRLRANAYDKSDSIGYIAGSIVVGSESSQRVFGHILLTLRKNNDGRWLIASEMADVGAPPTPSAFTAEQLIAQLDSAGIKRAVGLSLAYWFGMPGRETENEYAKVKAENDWVAQEVTRFPNRLIGFCSVNPLKEYALEELERCTRRLRLSGLKLHLANSDVDLRNPRHIEQLRRVFRTANDLKIPIVIHMRTRKPSYGRHDAEIFLRDVLPAAPDIPVQIAHMAGWGGYDTNTDQALAAFAEAISAGNPHAKKLYFDLTTVAVTRQTAKTRKMIAERIRQIGLQRILFGSDTPPGDTWKEFVRAVPLREEEFRTIAANVTPYLR